MVKAYGSRYITGAKCVSCGADLPDCRTSRDGGWLWSDCPKCGAFNSADQCLKHGGRLIQ